MIRSLLLFVRMRLLPACLIALLLMGGTCERYKRKMARQNGMHHYYDSVLKLQRHKKFELWEKERQKRHQAEQQKKQ